MWIFLFSREFGDLAFAERLDIDECVEAAPQPLAHRVGRIGAWKKEKAKTSNFRLSCFSKSSADSIATGCWRKSIEK